MSRLTATFVTGAVSPDGFPRAPVPEIAVSGRSNVGKSSLLNVLVNRKGLAKVSGTPGKTREINFFTVADRYHLVDLPGYGFAKAPVAAKRKWGVLVQEYLRERWQLAGVVQLVDLRHGPTADDRNMIDWLLAEKRPTLIVGTKQDKLKKGARLTALRELAADYGDAGLEVLGFSAVTRDGTKPILAWMDAQRQAWREAEASRRGGERPAAEESE